MLPLQRPRPCSSHGRAVALRTRLSLRVVARQLDDPQHSINVRNLTLSLGPPGRERRILNGVDLKIRRGSLHMLLGPNGCGKSTLLKVLGGLIPSYEGTVDTDQPTGFVFQNPDHQVVMPTVAADVAFGLGRWGVLAKRHLQVLHRLNGVDQHSSSGAVSGPRYVPCHGSMH